MEILFEDDQILAILKPSGLPSHSLSTTDVSAESELKQIISQRPTPQSIFLLHRLDTGTSGVLLFAKSEGTWTAMREKFKRREIQKYYFAWSSFTPERGQKASELILPFTLDLRLAHHPQSSKRMIPLPEGHKLSFRGKPLPAITRIFEFQAENWQNEPAIRFRLEILTGVMHQIRAHFKWLGFPLLGDAIYGDEKGKQLTLEKKIRLGLHAHQIQFELDGNSYDIKAPI